METWCTISISTRKLFDINLALKYALEQMKKDSIETIPDDPLYMNVSAKKIQYYIDAFEKLRSDPDPVDAPSIGMNVEEKDRHIRLRKFAADVTEYYEKYYDGDV